jgi:hypothetical protein
LFVAILLVLSGESVAASAAMASEQRLVQSTLTIESTADGDVNVTGETQVRIPTDTKTAHGILGLPAGSHEREQIEERLAAGLDVTGKLKGAQPSDIGRIEIVEGTLRTWVADDDVLIPYEEERTGQFSLLWRDDLRVRTDKPRHPHFDWVVRVTVIDARMQTLDPAPTSLREEAGRTFAEWHFPSGEARSPRVVVDLPWPADAYAAVGNGDWWSSWGVALVISEVLFIVVLWLMYRGGVVRGPDADSARFNHQIAWLFVAAMLAVATSVFDLFRDVFVPGRHYFEWSPVVRITTETLPSLVALWCFAAVYLASRPSGRWRRVAPVALAIALLFLALAAVNDGTLGDQPLALELLLSLSAVVGLGVALYWLGSGLTTIPVAWAKRWQEGRWGRGDPTRVDRWRTRTEMLVWVVVGGTTSAILGLVLRDTGDAVGWATSEILFVADNLVFSASSLFSLAVLPAVVFLVANAEARDALLGSRSREWQLLCALYLFFVVPASVGFVGFRLPLPLVVAGAGIWVIASLRRKKLERLEKRVAELNPNEAVIDGESLLARFRRELLDRTFVIQSLRRRRANQHQGQVEESVEPKEVIATRGRVKELDEAEAYFQTGQNEPDPSLRGDHAVRLKFPGTPPLIYAGLGSGPGRNWQENGSMALGLGTKVAALPIGLAIGLFLASDLPVFVGARPDLGVLFVADILLSEVATWLVATFVLGCLFTWLPGGNGPLKGCVLAAPAIAAIGLCTIPPPIELQDSWLLYSLKLLFVLSATGLLMDVKTMSSVGFRPRDLLELYQVRSLRFGLVSLLPIAISLLGIYIEIRTGNSQSTLEHAIRSAPSASAGAGE